MPNTIKTGAVKKFTTTFLPKVKNVTPLEEQGRIIDYLDVETEGYASTFAKVTPEDRYGDYILPGAFSETLAMYNNNPIVLKDHNNSCDSAAARSMLHFEDEKGLFVRNKVSNAPGLRDLRFKLVEGVISAYSIGGFFYYLEDMRGIYKIELFEYSFVGVPANPDALFNVRKLNLVELKHLINITPKNDLENIGQTIKSGNVVDAKNFKTADRMITKALGMQLVQEKQAPQARGLTVGGLKIIGG